jgi:hypothetical protein
MACADISSSFQSVENGTAAGPGRRRGAFGRRERVYSAATIGRFGDRILTGDLLIRGVLGFFAGVGLVGRIVELVRVGRGIAVDPGRNLVRRGGEQRRGMHEAPVGEMLDEFGARVLHSRSRQHGRILSL